MRVSIFIDFITSVVVPFRLKSIIFTSNPSFVENNAWGSEFVSGGSKSGYLSVSSCFSARLQSPITPIPAIHKSSGMSCLQTWYAQ